MIAKTNHVSIVGLAMMESTHLPANVPLDGLGSFAIQVNEKKFAKHLPESLISAKLQ